MKIEQIQVSVVNRHIFSLSDITKKFFLVFFSMILLSGCGSGSSNSGSLNPSGKTNVELVSNPKLLGTTSTSPTLNWTKQADPNYYTQANGAATDLLFGNSYVAGSTQVGISGNAQTGHQDYFLAQYNSSGYLKWTKQVGTSEGNTIAKGVSTDSYGNIYVTGYTDKEIAGQTQTGKTDYFIAKYDVTGDLLWTSQGGATNGNAYATGVKFDATTGSTYISGYTDSSIASGAQQAGKFDYFLAKYDYNGNLVWIKQVGSANGTAKANGISTDSHGNVYVAGYTDKGISGQTQTGLNDYFMAQYGSSGDLNWTIQVGITGGNTQAYGISADVYDDTSINIVGGTTRGISNQFQTGNEDYFIAQYNLSGSLRWTKQVGAISGITQANGVSTDPLGNIYIAGSTNRPISGQFSYGGTDYFIAMYNRSGYLQWTSEIGGAGGDTEAKGISNDNSNNVFVAGFTTVGISGQVQKGYQDYFMAKHDQYGSMTWSTQVSASGGTTYGNGVSTDESGNIYITGFTTVGISGQTQNGYNDYFIAKYDAASNLLWLKQVGTESGGAEGQGITTDNSGNIYVTGTTNVGISGQNQNGLHDYFITRYGADGSLIWSRQVGAPGGNATIQNGTFGQGIITDNLGNIYVTGYTNVGISGQNQNGTYDYFLARYESNGDLVWTTQVGKSYPSYGILGTTKAYGITIGESGNIYITGSTTLGISGEKQNGSQDYFIAKYNLGGSLIWTKQVGGNGSGTTSGQGISADSKGDIYVTGFTTVGISGQNQNGYNDYFIAKYNLKGDLIWTKQVGTARGTTQGQGISADNNDNIYVTGRTNKGISGQTQTGIWDYFITRYNGNSDLIWTTQVGGTDKYGYGGSTYGNGVSANESGIYITGWTTVGISGQTQHGDYDYFITKYIN